MKTGTVTYGLAPGYYVARVRSVALGGRSVATSHGVAVALPVFAQSTTALCRERSVERGLLHKQRFKACLAEVLVRCQGAASSFVPV